LLFAKLGEGRGGGLAIENGDGAPDVIGPAADRRPAFGNDTNLTAYLFVHVRFPGFKKNSAPFQEDWTA